jgi:hypothetical protein
MVRSTLSTKAHDNPRSSRDVHTSHWRLLSRNPAANGVEIESGILRGFNRNPQVLAQKRWHLNPSLFYVKNHRSADWRFLRK